MGRYEVSERRATRAARFCLSSVRYQSHRDPLTALRQRMRELAQTRVRFGYRRLLVLLRREGGELGKKRCYRLYTDEGLALRRKRPWRHATAAPRAATTGDGWQRHLEHGLRRGSIGRWAPIPCPDGAGSLHASVSGDRHWAGLTNGVILDFSRAGSRDNAAIESFNGRFREEV